MFLKDFNIVFYSYIFTSGVNIAAFLYVYAFIPLGRYIFSSGVIFLLPEGFSLTFLIEQVCW